MTALFRLSATRTRLLAHLRDPLYRNGYALVFSAAATSALGIVYWILAARLYSAETIGLNSALLSTMGFLTVLAQLNLVNALNRFVPTAGQATKRLILGAYAASVAIALVSSLLFLAGIAWWAPALSVLRTNWVLGASFVLGMMVYCIFNLQDGVLVGMSQAIWVPIENLAFAVAKLLLLLLLVTPFADYGVYVSWLIPMALAIGPINWLIFRRLLPRHVVASSPRSEPLRVANVVHYVAGNYFASLLSTATASLLPLIVLQKAGAVASAYYSMTWTISYSLYLISLNMSMSLTTEAAVKPGQLLFLSYRTLRQTGKLLMPLVLGLVVGAPILLHFFGPVYAAEATPLLRLLALAALPNMITTFYITMLRIQRRIRALVLVNLATCLSVLLLSNPLLDRYGSVGVGLAWLISEVGVATVLLATELRPLWLVHVNLGWLLHWLAWPRTLRWRWQRRHIVAQMKQVIPQLVTTCVPTAGLSSPTSWQLQQILPTVNDMTVALLGPAGQPAVAVLKWPQTPAAEASLHQQVTIAATLRAHPALPAVRQWIPASLADGIVTGHPYLLETYMPGLPAAHLLTSDAACTAIRAAACKTINYLHQQTVTSLQVDEIQLQRWVDEPIRILQQVQPVLQTTSTYQQQLCHLQQEVRSALMGRTVGISWVHGDYAPNNLLLDPQHHTVIGVLDWELAAPDELPQLDLIHLFVAMRVIRHRCEYGDVIRTLLTDTSWLPQERILLDAAQASLGSERLSTRSLVLFCWLRHVAANLTKSEHYARHWWWKVRNLEAVLLAL